MMFYGGSEFYALHCIELIQNLNGRSFLDLPDPTITIANTFVGLEAHVHVVPDYKKRCCMREQKLFQLIRQTIKWPTTPNASDRTVEETAKYFEARLESVAPPMCDFENKCAGCPLDPHTKMSDLYLFFGKIMASADESDDFFDKNVQHMTMQ